ncbi:RICIN domain-containing protein [Mucilaginibacter sp. UR6-11]|uniref:RICIN domain-containing protein n=1 Tax=Mucilaginibacter sp. UR6-11 TaxID=1435644 RepID=UPI001E419FB8|nr:RICIN domain-containing protein [Mucilaginibacter sp. UR6-11]MCC8425822.1 RICIN domain-containing protein [Mucilaginibacter sp. UR6-11]
MKVTQLGAANQSTMALPASPPASYACFTISNVFSSKLLEVRGDSTLMRAQSNPANVQQNASAGSGQGIAANQKWYLIQQGTGTITSTTPFKIMNVENGMFLEAPNGTSGTTLWVDHSNGFPSQIWNIQLVSGQTYYIIKNSNGLVLTDHAGSTANGAPINEETATSSNTQYWNLNSITAEAYRDDVVVTYFHRGAVTNTTVAFDQGNSIPLTNGANNGKILWITQDAYASSQLQSNGQLFCQFFSYHNSGLLQPSITNWASASTPNITTTSNAGTGISALEIIKSPGSHNSTYTWPGSGVEIGSNVVLNGYESANGSIPANQALYSIAENTGSTTWGAATRLTPNGMSGQTKMLFSVGMIKKTTGDTVYVYGAQSTFFNQNAITLARFPANNPSSWSYWRGHSWASTPDTTALSGAITVGSGTATQANVMVSYVNGKYVMMQMDLGYFCDPGSHAIYISTATSPFGPFSTPKLVYTINDWYNGHLAKYYTPIIHGEFVNGHNELLVTYCLNYNASGGSCSTTTCFNNNQDPNYYQIKGVRIPYSVIGL